MKTKVAPGREIMAPWLVVTILPGRRARLQCDRCNAVALISRSDATSFTEERDWRRLHRKCQARVQGAP
jgi:hypothetical protein